MTICIHYSTIIMMLHSMLMSLSCLIVLFRTCSSLPLGLVPSHPSVNLAQSHACGYHASLTLPPQLKSINMTSSPCWPTQVSMNKVFIVEGFHEGCQLSSPLFNESIGKVGYLGGMQTCQNVVYSNYKPTPWE